MKTVVITVTNDLLTDNRMYKTAKFLLSQGYKVILIGRKLQKKYPEFINDKNAKTIRLNPLFKKGKMFYAVYNLLLFWRVLFLKKDILLAVDLDTLFPMFLISKLTGKKLVYDSHEFFTELPELEGRNFTKSIWQNLEKIIIPHIKYAYTVSESIAEAYHKKYGIKFEIVRNLPEYKTINTNNIPSKYNLSKYSNGKKILLYQGAINLGRNIDLMIKTVSLLENYILIILGDGDLKEENIQLAKKLQLLNKKVFFLGRIPLTKLKYYTTQAHLGFSLEQNLGLNYRYALPNKLFDYIMYNVPQIVSPLPEMEKIIKQYETGIIYRGNSEEDLAKLIIKISPEQYTTMKQNCIKAAKELNWEKESLKLKSIYFI